jgi:hypothetical protein
MLRGRRTWFHQSEPAGPSRIMHTPDHQFELPKAIVFNAPQFEPRLVAGVFFCQAETATFQNHWPDQGSGLQDRKASSSAWQRRVRRPFCCLPQ